MRQKYFIITCFCILLCGCGSKNILSEKEYNHGVNIIPMPQNMQLGNGKFTIDNNTRIIISDDSLSSVADFYSQKIQASTGFDIKVTGKHSNNSISLSIDSNIGKDLDNGLAAESYTLSVKENGVDIKASTLKGIFYGMATFMQLLPAEIESSSKIYNAEWTAPVIEIKDSPRFKYRGLMLDVARHFISVEGLKKHIDMLALVKINNLHLHLTDFQGWRIEIKKYPKLTEIGGTRIDEYGNVYSGYYTQEEIKELVKYAQDRFINIIPEIDVPGHSLAAIASYPELSCTGEKYDVMSRWGPFPVVFCPGKEDMFELLDGVFAEMSTLFPSEYFHIGGDECPKKVWETCPNCQRRIKEEGLFDDKEHTAEDKLQSYAISRCEQILKKYGKKMIGWDEILQGGLAPEATVMSWRGEKGGIASALMDHNVIMTPTSGGMYLDHYQGNSQAEPFAWGAYAPIVKSYNYNPVPDTLVRMGKEKYILGVQANAWTECMYTEDIVEYRVYPRIFAVAETGWTEEGKKNFDDFSRRLNNMAVRMDCHDINYHIPLPEQPDFCRNHVAFTDVVNVSFDTSRPMKMVYTTDGTEPGLDSPVYSEPIMIDKTCTIKIRSVLPSGKMSIVRDVFVERQSYKEPDTSDEPVHSGLKLRFAPHRCMYVSELGEIKEWKDSVLTSIEPIVRLRKNKYSNVEFYAAVAEGFFYVPESGIYEFSSNNTRITVGDYFAVDNDGKPQINSKYGKSMALKKGWHKIKVEQISNFIGGWNSQQRNNGAVMIRKYGDKKWTNISKENIKYN